MELLLAAGGGDPSWFAALAGCFAAYFRVIWPLFGHVSPKVFGRFSVDFWLRILATVHVNLAVTDANAEVHVGAVFA